MAYLATYRKYRPKTFADIIGQEHITTTLKNQIKAGQISHAYLFCGIRGTGKTSAAKVFAKALNCLNPNEQEPCGVCSCCVANESDAMADTIEMDAASNRGIEEIRQIKESVKYPPAMGAYKIYIIDEVHMLTMEAFNALLKTLEEPPQNVVFILATTESHRLPYTIVSRTQRYDFRRLRLEQIQSHIETICKNEGIAIEERAANRIALLAEGAMRDALSLLDKCIAYAFETVITTSVVDTVTGRADDKMVLEMMRALFARRTEELFALIQQSFNGGSDAATLLGTMIACLRDMIIVHMPLEAHSMLLRDEDTVSQMKVFSEFVSQKELIRAFDILIEAQSKMPFSSAPRYVLECALLKAMQNETERVLQPQPIKSISTEQTKPVFIEQNSAAKTEELTNTVRETKESAERKKIASEKEEEEKQQETINDKEPQSLKKKIVAELSKKSPFIALGVENADLIIEKNRLVMLLAPNDYRLIGDDMRLRADVVLAARQQFAQGEEIEVEIKVKERDAEEEFKEIIGDILIIEE